MSYTHVKITRTKVHLNYADQSNETERVVGDVLAVLLQSRKEQSQVPDDSRAILASTGAPT